MRIQMSIDQQDARYERPGGEPRRKANIEYVFKITAVLAGVIMVFGVIIGSYFWNLVFDPSNFDLKLWLQNTIFIIIISLVMMVLGFIDMDATVKSMKRSNYNRDRAAFNEDVGSIYEDDTIVFFDQFIPWLAERQLRQKKIRYLTAHGISTADAENLIDYATEDDLPIISGIKPGEEPTDAKGKPIVREITLNGKNGEPMTKKVVVPAIKGKCAAYVQDMLSGAVTIDVEDPSYYLTDSKTKELGKTSLESSKGTEKERRKYVVRQFITKALFVLVVSLITTLLAPSNHGGGDSGADATLAFRLVSAFGGFASGSLAGLINVTYTTRWINDKHKVVNDFIKFLKTGVFKPLTKEQMDELTIKAFEEKEAISVDDCRAMVEDPAAGITESKVFDTLQNPM